jgi:hypothetical protein
LPHKERLITRRLAVIRDIVVNLATGNSRDPATAYAISVARMFDAQIAGIAMCYSPVILTAGMEAVPADFVESLREECARAANEAIGRFKQAAAKADLPAEAQMVETSIEGTPKDIWPHCADVRPCNRCADRP